MAAAAPAMVPALTRFAIRMPGIGKDQKQSCFQQFYPIEE